MAFCNECGEKNPDGAKFCRGCGGDLAIEETVKKERVESKTYDNDEEDDLGFDDIEKEVTIIRSHNTTHDFFENMAVENERKKPKPGMILGIGGSKEEEMVEYSTFMYVPYFNVKFEYEDRVTQKTGFMKSETRVIEKDGMVIAQGNPLISPEHATLVYTNDGKKMMTLDRIADDFLRSKISGLLGSGSTEVIDADREDILIIPSISEDLADEIVDDIVQYRMEGIATIPPDLRDRFKIRKKDTIYYPMYVAYYKEINSGIRRWAVFDGLSGEKESAWTRFVEENGYIRDILKERMV